MTGAGPSAPAPAWARAAQEHREVVAALLEAVESVPDEAWRRPREGDRWSPAQIAEHLVLTYEEMLREISGAAPMRPRVPGWQQIVLRWFLLPHILFHQSFPLRARSPREIRPSEAGIDREGALERLPALAETFEAAIQDPTLAGRPLQHPYFGPISPLKTLRFHAAHLEHHRRQIQEALSS